VPHHQYLRANASRLAACFLEMNGWRHATQRRYPCFLIARRIVVVEASKWSSALIRAHDLVRLVQDSETNRKMRLMSACFKIGFLVAKPLRVVREEGALTIS